MKEILADNYVYTKLPKTPLVNVSSKYNRTIERIFSFSRELKQKLFKPYTPSLPYRYGLINTHNPDNPVKPIMSSIIGSCSYELSKCMHGLHKN